MTPTSISGSTKIFGVIGESVRESLSPAMHNAWLREAGLDAIYVAFPAPAAPNDLPRALRDLGIAGANVTAPFKRQVMSGLSRLDPLAARVGAVNTVVLESTGETAGYNTDIGGFSRALAEVDVDPAGLRAVVLGAGGAARAVVAALNLDGARVTVLARDRDAATATAGVGRAEALNAWGEVSRDADLVVNTLPPAADPLVLHLGTAALPPGCTWIDIGYGPNRPHLDALRDRGHLVQDGLTLLLHQGALAFRLFTGLEPNLSTGRHALVHARRPGTR